jgi:hypothetical protein
MTASRAGCHFLARDAFKWVKSSLKGILSWYEGADNRCRHEIFGDIFLLAFFVWVDGVNGDFLLMMPSRHLCPASNTPDPELPVVATSNVAGLALLFVVGGCAIVRERRSSEGRCIRSRINAGLKVGKVR